MIVPNYVPEPLEVPANVTQEDYSRRLRFIRNVTIRHGALVLLILAMAASPMMESLSERVSLVASGAVLAGLLIALDLLRIARRGLAIEGRASSLAIPAIVFFTALVGRTAYENDWPVITPIFGLIVAWFYTAIAGRDYSFVGNFVISLAVSTVILVAWETTALGYFLNAAFLLYWTYDLASLLSRRRVGEEWAASVDLFRDVFNLFGYVPRVIRHWHRHDIWSDLPIRPPLGPS